MSLYIYIYLWSGENRNLFEVSLREQEKRNWINKYRQLSGSFASKGNQEIGQKLKGEVRARKYFFFCKMGECLYIDGNKTVESNS